MKMMSSESRKGARFSHAPTHERQHTSRRTRLVTYSLLDMKPSSIQLLLLSWAVIDSPPFTLLLLTVCVRACVRV